MTLTMVGRRWRLPLAALALFLAWTFAASWSLIAMFFGTWEYGLIPTTHIPDNLHKPWIAWWTQALTGRNDDAMRDMLVNSALAGAVIIAVVLLIILRAVRHWRSRSRLSVLNRTRTPQKIERANTDNLGHAALMDDPTARATFPAKGGKLVGMLADGTLLFDECFNSSAVSFEFIGTRMGKAQPLDAKVLTPVGFVRMGDLHVGDLVQTPDGRSAPITGIFPQGQKEVFEVIFEDGRSAKCCDDHLWKVWGKRNYDVGWRIESLEWIRRQLSMTRRVRTAIPLVEPYSIEFPDQNLPIPPYTMGAFLGDGCFRRHNILFSTKDVHILDRILSENPDYRATKQSPSSCDYRLSLRHAKAHQRGRTSLKSLLETTAKFLRGGYHGQELLLESEGEVGSLRTWARRLAISANVVHKRLRMGWSVDEAIGKTKRAEPKRSYSPFMVAMESLGLSEARSKDKFVPDIYKQGSSSQRLALLQGLLDTDGSVSASQTAASFTTTSRQLAEDVRELAWSLGAIVNMAERQTFFTYSGERKPGLPSWRLNIVHPDIAQMFSLPRKVDLCRAKAMRHRLRIVDIKPIGMMETQCISIATEEGLYVTDNYVVTHNTSRLVAMIAFWAIPELLPDNPTPPEPVVVFDPAAEIGHMVWKVFTSHARRVFIMNPDREPKDEAGMIRPWASLIAQTNIIGWINITHPLAAMHVHAVTQLFFEEDDVRLTGSGEFFAGTAESLMACLLAHVLWDTGVQDENGFLIPPLPRDLISVREFLSLPADDLRAVLTYIRRYSASSLARRYAGPLCSAHIETFSDIHLTCDLATRWLSIDAIADMVCGDTFDITDICYDSSIALFVQLPMGVCLAFKNIARVVFGTIVQCKVDHIGTTHPLVVTDESWMLKARAIRQIILNGGKYRIALHQAWQSRGDMDRVWGRETRESFFDNAAWIALGPLGDVSAAKEVSEACGHYGAMAYSSGDNSGVQYGSFLGRWSRGRNLNRHPIKRFVFFCHEIMQDLDRNVRLILRLKQPLVVGAAPYFQIKELDGWIDPSPYARTRETVRRPWYRLYLRKRMLPVPVNDQTEEREAA